MLCPGSATPLPPPRAAHPIGTEGQQHNILTTCDSLEHTTPHRVAPDIHLHKLLLNDSATIQDSTLHAEELAFFERDKSGSIKASARLRRTSLTEVMPRRQTISSGSFDRRPGRAFCL